MRKKKEISSGKILKLNYDFQLLIGKPIGVPTKVGNKLIPFYTFRCTFQAYK